MIPPERLQAAARAVAQPTGQGLGDGNEDLNVSLVRDAAGQGIGSCECLVDGGVQERSEPVLGKGLAHACGLGFGEHCDDVALGGRAAVQRRLEANQEILPFAIGQALVQLKDVGLGLGGGVVPGRLHPEVDQDRFRVSPRRPPPRTCGSAAVQPPACASMNATAKCTTLSFVRHPNTGAASAVFVPASSSGVLTRTWNSRSPRVVRMHATSFLGQSVHQVLAGRRGALWRNLPSSPRAPARLRERA